MPALAFMKPNAKYIKFIKIKPPKLKVDSFFAVFCTIILTFLIAQFCIENRNNVIFIFI